VGGTSDIKCIKAGHGHINPTETPFDLGDYHAAAVAFCDVLDEKYDVCDIHVSGKDFACMSFDGYCTPRYVSIESMLPSAAEEWLSTVYKEDIHSNVDILESIFDYTDDEFDRDSQFFFTWYWSLADIISMPRVAENYLRGAQLEERFNDYYMNIEMEEMSYSAGGGDGHPFVEYIPTYTAVEVPVLDLEFLREDFRNGLNRLLESDITRVYFKEVFVMLYGEVREVQMMVTDEQLDPTLLMYLVAEQENILDLFWDVSDLWTEVLSLMWADHFPTVDEYGLHIQELHNRGDAF
jgi:hypothetical protein